jgi:hypothetical protein
MARLKFLTIISLTTSFLIAFFGPEKTRAGEILPADWLKQSGVVYTPKEHIRPGDQTFLTFPEWFLVHSPREQAEYFATTTASSFPYLTHIEQLWKSYAIVNRQISGRFDFNGGYHLMIGVIAVSTTVEYAIKAFYEKWMGRLTDTRLAMTAEDKFNAWYWQDYTNFIMQTPWYEYDYFSGLKKLWFEIPFSGENQGRKWERRFYLTTEFLIKGGYGWVIKKATKSIYEEPILNTAVVVTGGRSVQEKAIKFLKRNADDSVTYLLPRYADFAPHAQKLADAGYVFHEIAGNKTALLVTLHAAKDVKFTDKRIRPLFSQPILTRPGLTRLAVAVRVPDLSRLLNFVKAEGLKVEHIYDY